MDQIQTNQFLRLLDEIKVRNAFFENLKTFGVKWHGGKPQPYLTHITPVLAVISAFPFPEQDKISFEDFDLLNFKWIAICLDKGWVSASFARYKADDICNAIDVLFGIGKYCRAGWPNYQYNNILTCLNVLEAAKEQWNWNGEVTQENWQKLHDVCVEGIRRRQEQIKKEETEFRERRTRLLQATTSVFAESDSDKILDDPQPQQQSDIPQPLLDEPESDPDTDLDPSTAPAPKPTAAERVAEMAEEGLDKLNTKDVIKAEAEERQKQIEEEARRQAEIYKENLARNEFNRKKQEAIKELNKEIADIKREVARLNKKVANTNANNQMKECNEALQKLCTTFMDLCKKNSWLETLRARQFGESLEPDPEPEYPLSAPDPEPSAPTAPVDDHQTDEEPFRPSGCRLCSDEANIHVRENKQSIIFNKFVSNAVFQGGYKYAKAVQVSSRSFHLIFCNEILNDNYVYGNVTCVGENINLQIASKDIVLLLAENLDIEKGTSRCVKVRKIGQTDETLKYIISEK